MKAQGKRLQFPYLDDRKAILLDGLLIAPTPDHWPLATPIEAFRNLSGGPSFVASYSGIELQNQ